MRQGRKILAAELRACHAQGLTVREAAAALDASPACIWRRSVSLGITFCRPRRRPLRSDQFVDAISAGFETAPEIAARLGLERPFVSNTLFKLERKGIVARVGKVRLKHTGRSPLRWRVAELRGAA